MSHTTRSRLAAIGATALALLVVPVDAAQAHVTVKPDSTLSGEYAELVFKVPNEKPSAATTQVVVTLPDTTPLTSVSVRPVPGWTATVTEASLPKPVTVKGTTITAAPHLVTWTATGDAAIKAGQYQSFAISAGPLPAPGKLAFPAAQTYSDGSVVTWADPAVEGQPEPAHPAPAFTVTAAKAVDPAVVTAEPAPATGSTDPLSRWLAGGALLAALTALAFLVTRRRPGSA